MQVGRARGGGSGAQMGGRRVARREGLGLLEFLPERLHLVLCHREPLLRLFLVVVFPYGEAKGEERRRVSARAAG